jgi:hypothetical protein
MKRAILVVLVVAGSANALAASSRSSGGDGTSTFLLDEHATTELETKETQRLSPTSVRATSLPYVRFGSGLEDDDPRPKPNVLLQSGLESALSSRQPKPKSDLLRFGSGLEDDAPLRKPNILLQSGLEEPTVRRSKSNRSANDRFGSGLEDEAPSFRPKAWHHPGF